MFGGASRRVASRPAGFDLPATRPASLRRDPAFARIWSASTLSELGSQVSLIALPFVAITTLDATTLQVAALGGANAVPG